MLLLYTLRFVLFFSFHKGHIIDLFYHFFLLNIIHLFQIDMFSLILLKNFLYHHFLNFQLMLLYYQYFQYSLKIFHFFIFIIFTNFD